MTAASTVRRRIGVTGLTRLREAGVGIVIALLVIGFTAAQPRFLNAEGIASIGKQSAIFAIIAVGETFVIITRNIDLSVGSTVGLSALVSGTVLRGHPHLPSVCFVAIAILVGLACGLVNGLLVAVGQIPAIVVTLGTLAIFRGIAFIIVGNRSIEGEDIPTHIGNLAVTSPLRVSWLLLIAALLFIVGIRYLSASASGRYFFAVGSNPAAAVARGVPVRRTVITAFVISGALAGLGGAMYLAKFGTADPQTAGYGYELWAISAVVVGGTNILGGSGGLARTLGGVLLIGVVHNGLTIVGLADFWQTVVQGSLILLAVGVDASLRSRYESQRQRARRRAP